MTSDESPLTYADAGVDIERGERTVRSIGRAVASTRRAGADGTIGGFGGLFDIAACGYRDPVLVAACDGVGTKLRLAIEAGRHGSVGVDLVAMCVNDLVVQGAEPLFFLDYLATSRLDLPRDVAIVEGIAAGCREAGCALIGGETAEMPGMYGAGDYDLAGFAVGAVERDARLPRATKAGSVLLGLASSGLHSNGYSLVRRVLERVGDDRPADDELLAPTRIYVRSLLDALRENLPIEALAHITGGGLEENVPRVLPPDLAARVDLSEIAPQPVFAWLRRAGPIEEREMLRTFNCGVGMVIVVAAEAADATAARLSALGEDVRRIGELVPRTGAAVEFVGALRA